jgi:hypothetical protein
MKTNSFININHINDDYKNNFIKLTDLLDDLDESNIEIEVELDDWQPEQKESWGYYGGCEYIPAGYCDVSNVKCNGIEISRWLNREGVNHILNTQNSCEDGYW